MALDDNYREVIRKSGVPINGANDQEYAIRTVMEESFIDPTRRLRVSNPYTLFSNKNLHGRNESIMKEATSGGTETITFVADESSVDLTVGTVSGEYIIRQSRHIPYVPGKGIRAQLTGKFDAAKANNVQRIGYFDDFDGPHFALDVNGVSVVLRSSTSGAASDAATYYQSDWNLDTLDGSGDRNNPSGINLDITKVELFYIDALWQGVGRVRWGLDIDGELIYVHEVNTANISNLVYMMRPSLPLRYEIRNTGITASSTTLTEICCQVDSEGGFQVPGVEFAAPGTFYNRTLSSGAQTPIIGIRLKNTLPSGKLNRVTARLLDARARISGTGDAYLTMHHLHDPVFTGGTWVSVSPNSAVEYNIGLTSVTATYDHVIDAGPVNGGTGGQAGTGQAATGIFNEHGVISQNIAGNQSQAFVVYGISYSSTPDASVSIKWTEFD